jgi:hypothetical protein
MSAFSTQSRHGRVHCTCPLSGVERTNFGGQLHLRLRHNDLLKISRLIGSGKTRWGKQRGKQFDQADALAKIVANTLAIFCRSSIMTKFLHPLWPKRRWKSVGAIFFSGMVDSKRLGATGRLTVDVSENYRQQCAARRKFGRRKWTGSCRTKTSCRTKKTCSLTKFRMRHWKLREGMKQGILAWRPARIVSGVFQVLQLEHQQDKVVKSVSAKGPHAKPIANGIRPSSPRVLNCRAGEL